MTTYLFANRAPKDYRGSADGLEAWNKWFDELGSHLVERGNPAFRRESVGAATTATDLVGYTLVEAKDLDEAVGLAKTCPLVGWGGGIEVGELTIINQ
jgi:hypothetical protein